MNITFDRVWDDPSNNYNVYPGQGRFSRCSQRELFVIVGKITTSDIWCDSKQIQSVQDFIREDLPAQEVRVMKGLHPDRFERHFGLHVTLKVMSGCRSGNTFHAYGYVKEHAWIPHVVMMYDSTSELWPDHFVSRAVNRTIVVPAGVMPAPTPGSPASMA